mmetsp:Transcript_19240/g.40579  ORF Transcript_19240/g.40579 Transcript_19240/m.40579 type:complete len:93 (+) Transcript_19240:305-583(+)
MIFVFDFSNECCGSRLMTSMLKVVRIVLRKRFPHSKKCLFTRKDLFAIVVSRGRGGRRVKSLHRTENRPAKESIDFTVLLSHRQTINSILGE